ncbi:SacI homology domain-containing protein, partial [Gaertneriomyces semiglobifer]
RTIVLRPAVNVSNTALVFECLEAGTTVRSTARFQPSSTLNFATFRPLHLRPVFGCLGLVQVLDDLFIGIVTEAAKVGDLEGSPIYRIHKVAFYSLLSDKYDYQSPDATDGLRSSNPVGTLPEEGPSLHPCASLVKLLSTGSFYFSPVLDLTRSTQKRAVDAQQGASEISILESADAHFVWNKHLLSGLLQIREQELTAEERDDLDKGGLLITAMQGYVGMIDFSISSLPCRMALISRLSCKRAGTRLLSRGVNDDGHVSNFVETEFIIFIGQSKFSFVQIRGSVPVFWEQTGIQMTHKVTISRGAESSAPATRMHFMDLLDRYGRVHIVNLLGQGSSEQMLSELYRTSVMSMRDLAESVTYTEFDFHQKVKNGGYERLVELVTEIRKILDSFSFFLYDQDTKSIVLQQQGAVRTNCLDCLDRTNVVQTRIAKYVMDVQLRQLGKQFGLYEEESFATAFNGLWADNGDWLSRIYAGTGAMKSSYTRKGKATVLGFLDDAAKSVNRFVINNFQDKTRQEAIDLLLGKLALPGSNILLRNPMHDAVVKEMKARLHEYSSARMVTLFLGTWNVNGRQSRGESLNSWLFSDKVKFPEVYAIGVQELIELTPGAYITIDTNKLRLEWEATLKAALNSQSDTSYVLLRSLHLVALGLFVFVRSDCVGMIRHVESSTKKTGMGGMAANKGGIGLSLSIHDTSVAFVTAHLAAGQGAVDERNRDYWTIHNGLSFRGRKLAEHDMTFWFGDFNYRINRSNEEVRMSIRKGDLEALYMNDQLYDQRAQGRAFDEFLEGPITFDPTYKYDNNTVTYDTSEKCRIPAWTDRILYKGRSIDLKEYQRAELLMSDHRP